MSQPKECSSPTPSGSISIKRELLRDAIHVIRCPLETCPACTEISERYAPNGVYKVLEWVCEESSALSEIAPNNAEGRELPAVSSASRWPTGEDSVPALQDGRSTAGAIRDSAQQPVPSAPSAIVDGDLATQRDICDRCVPSATRPKCPCPAPVEGHCPKCGAEAPWHRYSDGAYEKTVTYAITLLEVHGNYETCLKYLRGVQEKFQ